MKHIEYNWQIEITETNKGKRYEFIDTESEGIDNYEDITDDWMPLEDMEKLVKVMPYPNPFEVLTQVPEAVFQQWFKRIIKDEIKDLRMLAAVQDHNTYGPIYSEEFAETDELKNISVIHAWNEIDGKVRYCITIEYEYKENGK